MLPQCQTFDFSIAYQKSHNSTEGNRYLEHKISNLHANSRIFQKLHSCTLGQALLHAYDCGSCGTANTSTFENHQKIEIKHNIQIHYLSDPLEQIGESERLVLVSVLSAILEFSLKNIASHFHHPFAIIIDNNNSINNNNHQEMATEMHRRGFRNLFSGALIDIFILKIQNLASFRQQNDENICLHSLRKLKERLICFTNKHSINHYQKAELNVPQTCKSKMLLTYF